MFHVKQPVTARERKAPRCPARPRTDQPRRPCVLTRGLRRTVDRRPRSAVVHGSGIERRRPLNRERQLCGPSSKTRGPPRSRAIPLAEHLRGVGGPRPLPQRTTRRRPAHRPVGRMPERPHHGALDLPDISGAVWPRLRRARLRAESAAGLRCLDDGLALQRMRSSASTFCLLAVVERISSHVVPDMLHVKHVATTACSVMRVSTLREEERCERRRCRSRRGATTSHAYATRALPEKRSAKLGLPSRERSTAYAPRAAAGLPFHVEHPPLPSGGNHHLRVYTALEGCERRPPIVTRPSSSARRSSTR